MILTPFSNKPPVNLSADVIVVLGAAVWPGGVASPALGRRVTHAVSLMKTGVAGMMVVSGGIGKNPPSEARVMLNLALEKGVLGEQIVLEETARSTLDSAIAVSDIMRERGWRTAVVVTDRYHLTRSVILFRCLGVRTMGDAPWANPALKRSVAWRKNVCREIAALPWSLLKLFSHRFRCRLKFS